ncbi:MAG: 1-acyl-sn-glycerol-3-phosphate acyltransferase [Proteobacteria bacterium]|nr:1-acyl-sn-glycerol-3-phosphate acyltransferase [Pseudomonadota bacterium]
MLASRPQSAPLGARVIDVVVTLACWIYFIFGFLFFFSFLYLLAFVFATKREYAFQRLNHLFFKGFLGLLRILSPRQEWDIDQKIRDIKSSIVICNHLSYLDPLILLSLLRRQKTIVKASFFKAPVFGWLIKTSGYLPASTEGAHGRRMIEEMETMGDFLGSGGNLFVFPEGTRSRDGNIGPLQKGVFKIARMYRCPLYVLGLSGTDKLFTPGKFLFNTRQENSIRVTILDRLEPEPESGPVSIIDLEKKVRQIFRAQHNSCGRETKGCLQRERVL